MDACTAAGSKLREEASTLGRELQRTHPELGAIGVGAARVGTLPPPIGSDGVSNTYVFVCSDAPVRVTSDTIKSPKWMTELASSVSCVKSAVVFGPKVQSLTYEAPGCVVDVFGAEPIPALVAAAERDYAVRVAEERRAMCGEAKSDACTKRGCMMVVHEGCASPLKDRPGDPAWCECRCPEKPNGPIKLDGLKCIPRP